MASAPVGQTAYTVKRGDTPSKIAAILGVSVDKVMGVESAFSKPGDARTLQIGAVIDIDGASGGEGPTAGNTKESYTGEDDVRFHGLAGSPEIWHNSDTGQDLLVFFIPGFDPPVPMTWIVEKDEDLKALFGTHAVAYDRVLTDDELSSVGALSQGVRTEVDLTEGNPWEGWLERYEREASVRPYLLDPEVAALFAAAGLEGRTPTTAEVESTTWFQEHSGAEQTWLLLDAANPKGAAALRDANRRTVKQLLVSAGVFEPDDRITDYIADRWTTGTWTEVMARDQINAVADPYYDSTVDDGLVNIIDDPNDPLGIDRNTDREEFARSTARKWLGPTFGMLGDQAVRDIAGRLRNDPNYEAEWIADLQSQRLGLFPEYEDPLRSYDEIAQPWRSVWFNIMGTDPDETASAFQDIVQGNNLSEAKASVRQYGLDTNNAQVTGQFTQDAFRMFGGGARGLIR